MKKRVLLLLMCAMFTAAAGGCGGKPVDKAVEEASMQTVEEVSTEAVEEVTQGTEEEASAPAEAEPSTESAAAVEENEKAMADGVYTAKFTTDSSMFHINEAYGDKGTLTVENGEMSIHITLPSKNIINLFPGKAEDAERYCLCSVVLHPSLSRDGNFPLHVFFPV